MNQKTIKYRQAFTYIPIIYSPYRILSALSKQLGLLDSQKLWNKIIKLLGIVQRISISEVFQMFIGYNQARGFEAPEDRLAIMGLLTLLVATWIRLGKQVCSSLLDSNGQNIIVMLSITGGIQKSEINVEIEGSRKLQKEEFSKMLHRIIQSQCEKYELRLQEDFQSNDRFYIISLKPLFFDQISFPSIIEISGIRNELQTRILMRREKDFRKAGLTLKEFIRILKYAQQLGGFSFDYDLYTFIEFYCEEMKNKLEESTKACRYYFIINPDDIMIFDRGKGLSIQIQLKSYQHYPMSLKDRPQSIERHCYSDKISQKKSLEKVDYWSTGMVLLGLVSCYQELQHFEMMLGSAKDMGRVNEFVDDEIEKVESQREFDSILVMKTLKLWLRRSDQNATSKTMSDIVPVVAEKKLEAAVEPKANSNLIWLSGLIDPLDQRVQQKKQIRQKVQEIPITRQRVSSPKIKIENKEFIHSISTVPRNTRMSYVNGNQTNKNVSHSAEGVNNPVQQIVYIDALGNQQVININGKQIKIDFKHEDQKQVQNENINNSNSNNHSKGNGNGQKESLVTGNHTKNWQHYEDSIKEKHSRYSSMQVKKHKYGIDKLGPHEKQLNVIAYKLKENQTDQLKLEILSDYNLFQNLPSKAAASIWNVIDNQKCSLCNTQTELYDNGCGHHQCMQCFQNFFKNILKQNTLKQTKCQKVDCGHTFQKGFLVNMLRRSPDLYQQFLAFVINNKWSIFQNKYTRCGKSTCKDSVTLFLLEEGNKVLYCQNCELFICTECKEQFHGGIRCINAAKKRPKLQKMLEQNFLQIDKIRKPQQKINSVSLSKYLREVNINSIENVSQLLALFKASITHEWSCKEREDLLEVDSQDSAIIEELIFSMKKYLLAMFTTFRDLGFQTNILLKQVAQEGKVVCQNLMKIHSYLGGLMTLLCFK